MNTRHITIFLVLGMAAALFLTRVHLPRPLLASLADGLAAAQTPAPNIIMVKSLPNTSGDDDPWHHFEVNVPQYGLPLDMHLAVLVDGKGVEYVNEVSSASARPLPFKYRLDTIDNFRLQAALAAQGYRLKKDVATYYFEATLGPGLMSGFNQTVRFKHEKGAELIFLPIKDNETTRAVVGEKVVLENYLLMDTNPKVDTNPKGYFVPLPEAGPFVKTPPGVAHRLDVYVTFQPHQGPPMNGSVMRPV